MTYQTYSHTGDCFKNPYRFSDIEDILENPQAASAWFQDLLVNRPTEFASLIRLYTIASHSLDVNRVSFTNRQVQAVAYAHEGMEKGVHPTRYVASQLNISPRSVQRLLKRASIRAESEMVAIQPPDHSNYESTTNHKWFPTKQEISKRMRGLKRPCAACGMDIRGWTLCHACGTRLGFTREEWNHSKVKEQPAPAKWLLPEARRIDRQVRKEAINLLFRAHGFDSKDFEEALEQYQFQHAS